jgi:hypothetical protein
MAKAEDPSLDPESAAIPQQVHLAGFVAAESAVGASQNAPGSGENTAGPAGPGSVESEVAVRTDATTWRAAMAVAGVAATAFGVVGAFIQVQNEPGKVWNMAAVLVVLVLAGRDLVALIVGRAAP